MYNANESITCIGTDELCNNVIVRYDWTSNSDAIFDTYKILTNYFNVFRQDFENYALHFQMFKQIAHYGNIIVSVSTMVKFRKLYSWIVSHFAKNKKYILTELLKIQIPHLNFLEKNRSQKLTTCARP